MTDYKVYAKDGGEFVYEYSADAPIEWNEYPFASFDHIPATPPAPVITPIYGGRRHLTKLEWRKLLTAQEEQAFDEIRSTVETMALPDVIPRAVVRTFVNRYNEATIMDMDDPDQARGFQLLVILGKMNPSRIPVIING